MSGGSRAASAKSKSTSAKAKAGPSLAELLQAMMPQGECAAGKALNPASGMCRIPCALGQERNLNNNCVNVKTLKSKGKRPPTGFNVFTRELSKKEGFDKSQLMTSASILWAAMSDSEKNPYKAKAAKLGAAAKVARVCEEGKEMNPATRRCRKTCAEGKTRSIRGNCVNPPKERKPKKVPSVCEEGKEMNPVTGRCRKLCPAGKNRTGKNGNCVNFKNPHPPRSCPEGQELNPANGYCAPTCPEGTRRSLKWPGDCVNTSRKAPKKAPKERKPCPEGKERNLNGNCANVAGLGEVLKEVRKMKDVPKSAVMAVALVMWEGMTPAAKRSYARKAAAKKSHMVIEDID